MGTSLILIATAVLSLAAVITLYCCVLPKKKDGNFAGGFWQWVHDYFHFKKLYIESILRFLFALATFGSIIFGILCMIYCLIEMPQLFDQVVWSCLGMIFLAPIGLRLAYELLMMALLLVKNVMEINKKLKPAAKDPETKAPAAPKAPTTPNYAPAPMPNYAPPAPPVYTPNYARPTAPIPTSQIPRPAPQPPRPAPQGSRPTAPIPVIPKQDFGPILPKSDFDTAPIAPKPEFAPPPVAPKPDFPTGPIVPKQDFPTGPIVPKQDFPTGPITPKPDFPTGPVVPTPDFEPAPPILPDP